jgi:hypothetical protein
MGMPLSLPGSSSAPSQPRPVVTVLPSVTQQGRASRKFLGAGNFREARRLKLLIGPMVTAVIGYSDAHQLPGSECAPWRLPQLDL